MMTGIVTAGREAVLKLVVQDNHGRRAEVEAVIDTGFTGYLTLPAAVIGQLSLRLQGTREATLGDGRTVMLDIYRAQVL